MSNATAPDTDSFTFARTQSGGALVTQHDLPTSKWAGANIVRVQHDTDRPFLIIAKETVCDHKLSFEARGFLAYLLTKPDTWRVRPEQIADEVGKNRATVYRLLNVLIAAKYVERSTEVNRKANGQFESVSFYTVYERPHKLIRKHTATTEDAGTLNGERIPF